MGKFIEKITLGGCPVFFKRYAALQCLLIFAICFLTTGSAHAKEKEKVAVLPFRVHALQPMDHLVKGLQEMVTTRMADKGLQMTNPDVVNKHPKAFQARLEPEDLVTLGKDLGVDTIISGSITQVGRKISLDVKAIDVRAKRPPFSLFMVEDDVDRLPEAVDRAATSLYNQIGGVVQIDSIQVRGNKRVETEAILAALESRKGESLDYDRIDRDLRAVFKMGFFKDVRVETEKGPRGDIVVFDVTEKPSISQVTFTGNDKVGEKDLKKETGIRLYTILNRNEIKQSINRVKEFYRKKGYYNVQIKEELKPLPQNEVALIYEINEGDKVYITNIEFIGNTHFDDDALKKVMMTSEKGLLSIITSSGVLDKKKLEFDLYKVTSFYHNQGYIKAKTGKPEIQYREGEGLVITVEVTEGPQFKINRIDFEGDLIRPVDELLRMTRITKEEAFNREAVRLDTLALKEFYASTGYAYATVTPLTKEYPKKHLVDITFKIAKNVKVRIERINIFGNTITRDKVIRRELRLLEGDYFSGQALERSTTNVRRLNFFDDVEIQRKKGSRDDLIVLDVTVKEKPTGSFSFGAGFSSYDKAIGSFSVSQNNLWGRGQKLSGSGSIGSKTVDFSIKFTEPWFLDRPISAGIDLYNYARDYQNYTRNSLGGALRFEFPTTIDPYTRGRARYGYDSADITNVAENASREIREMIGKNTTSAITLGLSRNSTDHPWFTTRGSNNTISYEYAGRILGGDLSYDRYLLGSEWYFSMPWKTVFLVKGHWGRIKEKSDGWLPSFKKFRLGGINTVRGFDFGTIGPIDPVTFDYLGGTKMMYYNVEYRFPVLKEQGVEAMVFFDAGNVFREEESVSFNGIRTAVGGGFRWYSPAGPILVAWGYNLDPLAWEKQSVVDFTMGGSF